MDEQLRKQMEERLRRRRTWSPQPTPSQQQIESKPDTPKTLATLFIKPSLGIISGGPLAQGLMRGFGAAAGALMGLPKQIQQTFRGEDAPVGTFQPQGGFQELLYGTDQPISLATEGSELTFGKVSPDSAAAPIIGGVLGTLDLTTGGAGKGIKGLVTSLRGVDNAVDATKIMKNAGFTDEIIEQYAPLMARAKDEAIIETALKSAETLQNTTRATTEATQATNRITDAITPKANVLSRERGFLSSSREAVPELKIGGQYIPRATDRLAIRARNLVRTDIATAERVALTQTDDIGVATASELIKLYGDLATRAKGAQKVAYYDKAADIATSIAPRLTEQGRAIQAAAILGRQTPEGMLRFAARTIQKHNEAIDAGGIRGTLGLRKRIPELTAEQAESILKQAKNIEKMPDGVEKALAFQKLQDEIADLVPSTWYQRAIALWKAGLLTGIKTTGLNTFSNLFHGVSEIAKDIPAAAVDSLASLLTGKRTLALTTKGRGGVAEGVEKGFRYLKTGFDERNVGVKLDWKRVNFGKSKFAKGVQKYEETVFRWLGSQDQPFYYGAKARSLVSQAIARGKNTKLKGEELKKFVQNLIENPTDEMLKYATNDAEMAVFTNRTLLGDVARGIQRVPGGEIVVPFGRTPAAVATQIINYSPVGIVKTIVENIGKGKFDQRLFSQGIGRGITGTAAMYIGMKMAEKGLISTDRPETDRERQQWELEGRKDNAFKVGDEWRSIIILGPLGINMIMGAHLKEALDKEGTLAGALSEASFASLKSFKEQTFLTGVNQFTSALNDPGRYGESVAARIVASTVPTIVSDTAKAIDPMERRTNATDEGFFAPTVGRVPGVRQTLEPQVDALGHPIERMGNAIETLIDPTRPTRIKSNTTIEELRRLMEAGFLVTPTSFAEDPKTVANLTAEQRTYLQEKAGQMLEAKLEGLFTLPQYKKAGDEEKAKLVKQFTDKARVIARAEMVEELTAGLQNEQLVAKLGELKASGFLTQEVFKSWRQLFR